MEPSSLIWEEKFGSGTGSTGQVNGSGQILQRRIHLGSLDFIFGKASGIT